MRVAIVGYGVEGKASYAYWRDLGHDVTIVDERQLSAFDLPYGVSAMTGPGVLEELDSFDLVVRSPGIAPSRLKTNAKVWSATNEFFAKCPASIVGVTGTKGKGTTASLINSILKAAGKKTTVVGNIGRPALEALEAAKAADVVIYELSSFQLWDVKASPHMAIVLMIEPDHLDVHKDFAEYVQAKANIRRFQKPNNVCLYHPTNKYAADIAAADKGLAGPSARYAIPNEGQVYVKNGNFMKAGQIICSIDALKLPGQHNLENACAAISAALQFGVDYKAVAKGLGTFTGLKHRLKFVAEIKGVQYYDDSIATTPGSAIAAIKAFEQPKVVILGGSDKGADYSGLAEAIVTRKAMRAVLTIGAEGGKIAKVLKKAGARDGVNQSSAKTMDQIVKQAATLAQPGDVVILSPAAASFDMFSSYNDRGDKFIESVLELDV